MQNLSEHWTDIARCLVFAVLLSCTHNHLHAQTGIVRATKEEVIEIGGDPFLPRQVRTETVNLALDGYCPVTLRDQKQWVLGSNRIQALRDRKAYLFATPRFRDIFVAAPESYLPVLDGDCPVTFAHSQKRVPGKVEFGLIYQRRIFLFASQEKRAAFEARPDAYTNADLVNDGYCVVSKMIDHRLVAGLPDTVAIVDGMRYMFGSVYYRKLFLLNPHKFGVSKSFSKGSYTKIEIPNIDFGNGMGPFNYGNQDQLASSRIDSIHGMKGKSKKKIRLNGDEEIEESIEFRAMSGYCPVTIHTQGIWLRGKSKYKFTFDGRVYFMAGTEEQAAFKQNPREYMPVLGGDSIVSYMNDYERVPGSIFHAVQYKGWLYLLVDTEEKATFRKQATIYEEADLAYRGNCAVTRIEEKREVAGLAEYETIYHGLRYRMASRIKLEEFLQSPQKFEDK